MENEDMTDNQWKYEQVPHSDDDLFVAIVTAFDGKQLIAQCTTLDFAKDIEDKHNRFDVEIGHLKFALAGARDRAETAEARLRELEADYQAVIERERIELIEWSARVDEQFKLRQQSEAVNAELKQAANDDDNLVSLVAQLTRERNELARQLEQAQKISAIELEAYRVYLGSDDACLFDLFEDMPSDERERYRSAYDEAQS